MSQIVIELPPALSAVTVELPDGGVLNPGAPLPRPPIVIEPPGVSAAAESLPARGTYPAASLLNRVHDLQDRKAETTEIDFPDLSLWFDNQIL